MAHDRRRGARRRRAAELQVVLEGVLGSRAACSTSCATSSSSRTTAAAALVKKIAGYHQFHAVRVAVGETLRAARAGAHRPRGRARGPYETGRRPGGEPGDRRVGVVWHTQGSGKSLTMAFYAGRVIREPAMENPTLVVITDRNDLDDQLFGTFSRCHELLRQPPVQAAEPRRPARAAGGRSRRCRLHDDPEVLPRGEGRPAPGALRRAATSSSSPTRRTAASTTSSTASPATCATRCPTPRSSASPARRSS